MPGKLTAENVRWFFQLFLSPTHKIFLALVISQNCFIINPKMHFDSLISTFLIFLVGSIIMPMKKVLAKCGGQVDFGVEGGGGWAQLILPLRLLLFYKVS